MIMKLEIGYKYLPEVRRYTYPSETLSGKRIVYISDLHYHRVSRPRVNRHILQIRQLDPDILLLGGDYVDTPFGLSNFQHFIESINKMPVFAIAGNHDSPYIRRIRAIVENAGAEWIHNDSTTLQQGLLRIQIDGTRPAEESRAESTGAVSTGADLSILCLHHPIDIQNLAHRYNLVFAGHLHGGQIVLWQNANGLYPVKWRYPLNRLDMAYGSCRYIISKGLGDTLPIRYACPRDIIVVDFESPNRQP
jgi:predicted MPP superfamily phosphohydrolase